MLHRNPSKHTSQLLTISDIAPRNPHIPTSALQLTNQLHRPGRIQPTTTNQHQTLNATRPHQMTRHHPTQTTRPTRHQHRTPPRKRPRHTTTKTHASPHRRHPRNQHHTIPHRDQTLTLRGHRQPLKQPRQHPLRRPLTIHIHQQKTPRMLRHSAPHQTRYRRLNQISHQPIPHSNSPLRHKHKTHTRRSTHTRRNILPRKPPPDQTQNPLSHINRRLPHQITHEHNLRPRPNPPRPNHPRPQRPLLPRHRKQRITHPTNTQHTPIHRTQPKTINRKHQPTNLINRQNTQPTIHTHTQTHTHTRHTLDADANTGEGERNL